MLLLPLVCMFQLFLPRRRVNGQTLHIDERRVVKSVFGLDLAKSLCTKLLHTWILLGLGEQHLCCSCRSAAVSPKPAHTALRLVPGSLVDVRRLHRCQHVCQ